MTVLIVEDDQDIAQTLRDILQGEGYEVRNSASAEEAEQILGHAGDVDLILLDDGLPGMSGTQLAQELGSDIPIFMMSGKVRMQLPTNAVGLLPKPFELADLLDIVRRYEGPPS